MRLSHGVLPLAQLPPSDPVLGSLPGSAGSAALVLPGGGVVVVTVSSSEALLLSGLESGVPGAGATVTPFVTVPPVAVTFAVTLTS